MTALLDHFLEGEDAITAGSGTGNYTTSWDTTAVEVSDWQGGHTLQVPGGHLLCVIPLHSDPDTFARLATTW